MEFNSAEKEAASAKTLRRERASALHETKLAGGTMSQAKKGNKEKDQSVRSRASGAGLLCAQTQASLSSGRTVGLLCSSGRPARVGPAGAPGASAPRLGNCYGTAGHDTQMSSLWTSLKSSGMN